jgi:hypothetical protein
MAQNVKNVVFIMPFACLTCLSCGLQGYNVMYFITIKPVFRGLCYIYMYKKKEKIPVQSKPKVNMYLHLIIHVEKFERGDTRDGLLVDVKCCSKCTTNTQQMRRSTHELQSLKTTMGPKRPPKGHQSQLFRFYPFFT